jgi:hypothetical protein
MLHSVNISNMYCKFTSSGKIKHNNTDKKAEACSMYRVNMGEKCSNFVTFNKRVIPQLLTVNFTDGPINI